jgi:hypothetical protein
MKQADVQVGSEYLTQIGIIFVRVRVIEERTYASRKMYASQSHKWTRFIVKRVDNGLVLAKARSAKKLCPI